MLAVVTLRVGVVAVVRLGMGAMTVGVVAVCVVAVGVMTMRVVMVVRRSEERLRIMPRHVA